MKRLLPAAAMLAMLLPPAGAEDAAVIFEYQRKGGFVGFNDSLKVFADYRWTMKGRLQSGKGKLRPEQQQKLKKMLSAYGAVKYSSTDGPRVADGMFESVTATGTGKGKATPAQAEAAIKAARALSGEVDRELVARKKKS